MPRSRAADSAHCTLCKDDSVHEPVHAFHGDQRMLATERYRRPADQRVTAPDGIRPPEEGRTLLTAEPLDLDYEHEIIRRVHQERD
jgi:hypothetical protein